MSYLIFATKEEAIDRSRQAWVDALGRAKKPEDVTEFLWGVDVGKDGQTALVVTEKEELLSDIELTSVTATIDAGAGGNWEKPSLIETGEITVQ